MRGEDESGRGGGGRAAAKVVEGRRISFSEGRGREVRKGRRWGRRSNERDHEVRRPSRQICEGSGKDRKLEG